MAISLLDVSSEQNCGWSRHTPLNSQAGDRRSECWQYRGEDRCEAWDVEVRIGKPLDVLSLKGTSLDDTRQYSAFLADTAGKLYAPGTARNVMARCPCCDAPTADATSCFQAFGVPYHRCGRCGHAFVRSQPAAETLAAVFSESQEHSSAYTDRAAIETRLRQVVQPKRDWMLDIYSRHCGRAAHSVLDVGAGGGHFVEVCRRAGLDAVGYEISVASRTFARQTFGLELLAGDFLADQAQEADQDVITMWGLLEYTSQPCQFLSAARRRIRPDGLLVVEVPRFDCLGTAVQRLCPEGIARHMDPTSHVNCFSDGSLATALVRSGFRIVAAWYFGMDAYELLVQIGLKLANPGVFDRLAPLIPGIQAALDEGRLCDDIIVAAVPNVGA